MSTIGIIDDRVEVRDSIKKRVQAELRRLNINWPVIAIGPFEEMENYPEWIENNEISVLLLDENLHEKPISRGVYADYDGHDLVKVVREGYKYLPIFVITAIASSEDVVDNAGEFDSIIARSSFNKRSAEYVKRFVRATHTYLSVNNNELERLSTLSRKIALGNASVEEENEAKALQIKLELPFTMQRVVDRETAINELETEVDSLSELSKKISKYIKSKKKGK